MTHDVYPGVKYLIEAGHSYVGQNIFSVYRNGGHRDHHSVYLCRAQKDIFTGQVALTALACFYVRLETEEALHDGLGLHDMVQVTHF